MKGEEKEEWVRGRKERERDGEREGNGEIKINKGGLKGIEERKERGRIGKKGIGD